jgi:peptidoglycan/LPS O-acetylase OafA/YrhL
MSHASAAGPGRSAFQIPSLDGLRTVSFLVVFFGHIGIHGIPGGFGVTVFFFLSGYLITTLLRLEVERTGKVDFKLFYLRRALRIWPPFYLVLIGSSLLALTPILRGSLTMDSMLALACHYGNYWMVAHGADGMPAGTAVYWSLAVEEHFYLVFPAIYLALVRSGLPRARQQAILFAICGATLLWRIVLIKWLGGSFDRTYLATDARFDSMLFGCCLAVNGNPVLDCQRTRDAPSAKELAWLALGLGSLFASFWVRGDFFRETFRYTLQGAGLYPIFVTAVRYPEWGVYRFLNLRWVKFLGTLSYSLYLVHQIVIMAIYADLTTKWFIAIPLALGISVGISTLIWYFIEEPCGELRRKLSFRSKEAKPSEALGDQVATESEA